MRGYYFFQTLTTSRDTVFRGWRWSRDWPALLVFGLLYLCSCCCLFFIWFCYHSIEAWLGIRLRVSGIPRPPPFSSRNVVQIVFIFVQDTFISYVSSLIKWSRIVHVLYDEKFLAEAELACFLTWCIARAFFQDFPFNFWTGSKSFFPAVGSKSCGTFFSFISEAVRMVVGTGHGFLREG